MRPTGTQEADVTPESCPHPPAAVFRPTRRMFGPGHWTCWDCKSIVEVDEQRRVVTRVVCADELARDDVLGFNDPRPGKNFLTRLFDEAVA